MLYKEHRRCVRDQRLHHRLSDRRDCEDLVLLNGVWSDVTCYAMIFSPIWTMVALWNYDLCNQTTELCFRAFKLGWKQATKQRGLFSLYGAENCFTGFQTTGFFRPEPIWNAQGVSSHWRSETKIGPMQSNMPYSFFKEIRSNAHVSFFFFGPQNIW
jgi:hypothetical protein